MDGFAIISSDTNKTTPRKPIVLAVTGDIAAGDVPIGIVKSAESIRIATGGMLPKGADSTIPIEDTNLISNDAGSSVTEQIIINKKGRHEEHVRQSG